MQNKTASGGGGSGSGSGSSKWAERVGGVGKEMGKRTEKDDQSKGKETGKEGEKKGFFQRKSEGLLAREMKQAKQNFWRPGG